MRRKQIFDNIGRSPMIFSREMVYVTGLSKPSSNDPITSNYESLFVGIVVDRETDEIVEMTCNTVKEVTCQFIRSIMVGYNIVKEIDDLVEEINDRFMGLAQKAVVAALKDARNKYMMTVKSGRNGI
jgi:hypothetical protein